MTFNSYLYREFNFVQIFTRSSKIEFKLNINTEMTKSDVGSCILFYVYLTDDLITSTMKAGKILLVNTVLNDYTIIEIPSIYIQALPLYNCEFRD